MMKTQIFALQLLNFLVLIFVSSSRTFSIQCLASYPSRIRNDQEFWQTLRGKIDDLWIMIIPWLTSVWVGMNTGGFILLSESLLKRFKAWSRNWSFVGWPQNKFIVVSRYSFQFSNNVCFDRITLNSNGWLFWISLWCRNGIIFIFCPLIQRLSLFSLAWLSFSSELKTALTSWRRL